MIAPTKLLTDEQLAVVMAPIDGPSVVDAGAGTGKTHTLVERAVHLVETGTLRPMELLVVTFTHKAANEIAERLAVAFQRIDVHNLPTCATFHSLAAELLREFAYETGESPDLRPTDDFRARGVFRSAYNDLLSGRLDVDISALPILERENELIRDLAGLALSLKNEGTSIADFERDALAAVPALRNLPFGTLQSSKKFKGGPKPERTVEDRRAEADREECNIYAVAALFRHFDALLEAEGLLTYGDLLTRSVAAFAAHPAIVDRLQRRWRHVLVDEFQDTNPQQLAFLRAMFGDELRPVMAVGDYRQAIYQWNGADPRGILDLKAEAGVNTFPLTLNRRSFQEILNAAHVVLPPEPSGNSLAAHAGNAFQLAVRHACFGDAGNTAACREVEATAIAAEIAALVAGGVAPSEIAILLRSRGPARVYASALRKHGISSRTHGGVGFFDAPEIRDAVAWFRLVSNPEDRSALARLVESPMVGFSDGAATQLFEHREGVPPWLSGQLPAGLASEENRRLERFCATLAVVGRALSLAVGDAVRLILRETAVDAARVSRNPDEARQIQANVAKLVSLADGFARERPLARLADFVAEIDTREELDQDESVAELGGEDVSIMTIHGAKGLEWEHVFVANVSSSAFPSRRGPGEIKVQRDPLTKALAFSSGIDGRKPLRWFMRRPHDPVTGQACDKPEADESEEERLFYVAVTRAKRCVWISGVRPKKAESRFLKCIRAKTADWPACAPFGMAVATADLARATSTRDRERLASAETIERLRARLNRPPSLFERWEGKLSYTAVARFQECPRRARYGYALRVPDFREAAEAEPIDPDDVGESVRGKLDPATYGNIIHHALEEVVNGIIEGRPVSPEAAADVALDAFESAGDPDLRARVLTALERSSEVLARFRPVAAEEEFDVTICGVKVGGFIDLITRDAEGDLWIVDYKTGHRPDAEYALQLALYRLAVRAKYPNVRLAILRIADEGVTFVEPSTPADDEVERAVTAAASFDSDEPRIGTHCKMCPYAGALCPEGALVRE